MDVFEPKVKVALIKAIKRENVAPGVSANKRRYQQSQYIDLTPYLSEDGSVYTQKGVREPAGAFSITFVDQPHRAYAETLYALIEPMDMVEIRMAHNPYDYAKPGVGYELPIVMRGFVSTISRSQAMVNDRPSRTITIGGQDFGKILQILRIYYLYNTAVGDNLLTVLRFFQKWAHAGDAKIKHANDFVSEVVTEVVNPYLKDLTALANGKAIDVQVANEMTVDSSVKGTIEPFTLNQFNDVSLYQLLTTVLDVGAFNELFVEDRENSVALVVRPTPYKDVSGEYIQEGAQADSIDITDADIVASRVSRTDANVANYFWASIGKWGMYEERLQRQAAQTGNADNFILDDYPNSDPSLYGFRKMEAKSELGPPDFMYSNAAKKEQIQKTIKPSMTDWLDERRAILAHNNRDNVILEEGTLGISGNEKIKHGRYLNVSKGENGAVKSSCYITSVAQEFRPYRGYTTRVSFERGTGFIERAQSKTGQYWAEVDARGVR